VRAENRIHLPLTGPVAAAAWRMYSGQKEISTGDIFPQRASDGSTLLPAISASSSLRWPLPVPPLSQSQLLTKQHARTEKSAQSGRRTP
jgi:hypothetical protein